MGDGRVEVVRRLVALERTGFRRAGTLGQESPHRFRRRAHPAHDSATRRVRVKPGPSVATQALDHALAIALRSEGRDGYEEVRARQVRVVCEETARATPDEDEAPADTGLSAPGHATCLRARAPIEGIAPIAVERLIERSHLERDDRGVCPIRPVRRSDEGTGQAIDAATQCPVRGRLGLCLGRLSYCHALDGRWQYGQQSGVDPYRA